MQHSVTKTCALICLRFEPQLKIKFLIKFGTTGEVDMLAKHLSCKGTPVNVPQVVFSWVHRRTQVAGARPGFKQLCALRLCS